MPGMLTEEIITILEQARGSGWVLEPEAKRLLSLAGIQVPPFAWVHSESEALRAAEKAGYPLVAKVVSPEIVHKSDAGGVAVGVGGGDELSRVFARYRTFPGFAGMLIEPMVSGLELIVGGKVDYQFGPIVLLGIGGTGVEIYHDTAIRMTPLSEHDVRSMAAGLKAGKLLEGYRGSKPINMDRLTQLLVRFSNLMTALAERVESIDLNPVMCSDRNCIVADARIMVAESNTTP